MEVKIFKIATDFLKRDFSNSLTIGYIVLVLIGMLFQAVFYWLFRINIVQYSEISDFLLAPFRDPTILIFVILTVAFIYFFTLFDQWAEKKFPRCYDFLFLGIDRNKYEQWYSMKGFVLICLSYVFLAAKIYGVFSFNGIRRETTSATQVTFKDNKFEPTDTLIYIGKTNTYVFFYNRTKKQTDIVPMADVLKIEVKP